MELDDEGNAKGWMMGPQSKTLIGYGLWGKETCGTCSCLKASSDGEDANFPGGNCDVDALLLWALI